MLQKPNRLAKTRDFNLLIKHGRFFGNKIFNLKWLRLAEAENYFPKKENSENFKKQLKIAISAGLKISKSAVKRNRLRRQAREVIRLLTKEEKIKNGYYLLFSAKAGALEKNFAEIRQDIELSLAKIGALKS